MKRHPGLRELSVEHHHALVHAHRLIAAAESSPHEMSDAAGRFLEFWDAAASAHFREEEEILLPVCARFGYDLMSEQITQMLSDHAHIRGMVMDLRDQQAKGGLSADGLRRLGSRLDAHVRLEERVIFPDMQIRLPDAALMLVGQMLSVYAEVCEMASPEEEGAGEKVLDSSGTG